MNSIKLTHIRKSFMIGYKKKSNALYRILSWFSGRECKRKLEVLKGVTLSCEPGEIVGVIGKNGCGKSTLLRIIAGIYGDYEGSVITKGRVLPMIGLGKGHLQRLSMNQNIHQIGSLFGMSQKEIREKKSSIISYAGLEGFEETKLYQFSSGMLRKLFFSIAIHTNPDILLLDEVFAVGDAEFRKKSVKTIIELAKNGTTIVAVNHQLSWMEDYCTRVIWLENGVIKKDGSPKDLVKEYACDTVKI